jgi:hypothetical protein
LLTQSVECLGEEFSKVVFVLEDFRRDVSLKILPQWLDCVQRWRVRRNEDELNAEFVGDRDECLDQVGLWPWGP